MEMQKNRKLIFIVMVMVLGFDYLTKFLLTDKNISIISNFFAIKYTKNYGAAWSIFANKRVFLIIISLIFLIFLYKYSYNFKDTKNNKISFGLVFGGLFGNLLDRILFGYVRDFISFQFGDYYYPIFNIADIAIVIGLFSIIIAVLKKEDNYAKDNS